MFVTLRPSARRDQFRERRRERVHRIVGELRIGDVTLHAVHREAAGERPATAHLDRVAAVRSSLESARRRRTSRSFRRAPRALPHAARAVDRWAFLVARDKERDRSAMVRMRAATKSSVAVTIAARPLFMSAAPRPYSTPIDDRRDRRDRCASPRVVPSARRPCDRQSRAPVPRCRVGPRDSRPDRSAAVRC